jgi:DNA-binding CsgD family transcriptional regulator
MQSVLESYLVHAAAPALAQTAGAASADSAELLGLLIDELAHGVVIVDAQRWIARANAAAMRELHGQSVLLNQRGRLVARLPADQDLLNVALQKASHGQRSLIDLTGGQMAFSVAALPLICQAHTPDLCGSIALVFSRTRLNDSGVFTAFARNHRLTPTEQLVLACLCRCLSTPQIALEMEIAVSTVRSHVRSLCAKTASSGVRELVSRLAMLPPLAAPLVPMTSLVAKAPAASVASATQLSGALDQSAAPLSVIGNLH